MKHIACIGIGFALFVGLAGLPAGAQNQAPSNPSSGSSLGDYARQVRKDPGTKAKPKVFDNDNLPKVDKLSVVGQTAATTTANSAEAKQTSSESASPATGEAKATATDTKATTETKAATDEKAATGEKATTGEKAPAAAATKTHEDEATKQAAWKQWADKIAAQKQQIDLLTRELDVLQREYQIRAAAMYADAGNRMRNSGDWDKQDAQYKQQIADKQKALEDAKQKLEDLREDARKAGVPSTMREE